MRINRNTVLVGPKVLLVPYRKQHVPRYHEWMRDPLIQEQTASEPLSLDQEYEMQQSWVVDQDKLTFIVLARPDRDQLGADKTFISIASAQDLISNCQMVGDVNIFFNKRHDDDDEYDEEHDAKESKVVQDSDSQHQSGFDAECEIMIAEYSYRRKGIAREALQMMFSYVTRSLTPAATAPPNAPPNTDARKEATSAAENDAGSHCSLPIPPNWLTCKISLKNAPSIQLFESLGFTRQKVSEIWQEVEMRFTDTNSDRLGQFSESINQVLYWQDDD